MYTHGGDVYSNKIELDYSININPLGPSVDVLKAISEAVCDINKYPQYDAFKLKEKLANTLGVNASSIVLTAGASQGFLSIVQSLSFETATIFYPGFFGYEYALNSRGVNIKREPAQSLYDGSYDILKEYSDIVFIANPNNPTGKCIDADFLYNLVEKAKERGIVVVIDECFLPLTSRLNESLCQKPFTNLIVVRSFTKTFAIPGIRLGYLICHNENFVNRIKQNLPEWNLSNIAISAGEACLRNIDYINESVELIEAERKKLELELHKLNFEFFPSDTNFILFKGPLDLQKRLMDKGILIRDCSNFYGLEAGYYRIAVKNKEDNERFIEILRSLYE